MAGEGKTGQKSKETGRGILADFEALPHRWTLTGWRIYLFAAVFLAAGFLLAVLLLPRDAANPEVTIAASETASVGSGETSGDFSFVETPKISSEHRPSGEFSLDAAREVIRRFLDAPNWRERLPTIYEAEALRDQIETYYQSHPDGAMANYQLKFLLIDEEPADGDYPLIVFFVKPEDRDEYPITVRHLPEGLKVDWDSFIEFKDREFERYLGSNTGAAQVFRVILERQSYWGEDRHQMKGFRSYQVESPIPEVATQAFVADETPLAGLLEKYFSWGAGPIATSIELERQMLPHGESHFIIKRLVTNPEASDGWHINPLGDVRRPARGTGIAD